LVAFEVYAYLRLCGSAGEIILLSFQAFDQTPSKMDGAAGLISVPCTQPLSIFHRNAEGVSDAVNRMDDLLGRNIPGNFFPQVADVAVDGPVVTLESAALDRFDEIAAGKNLVWP
jgi:hypothetical protein